MKGSLGAMLFHFIEKFLMEDRVESFGKVQHSDADLDVLVEGFARVVEDNVY